VNYRSVNAVIYLLHIEAPLTISFPPESHIKSALYYSIYVTVGDIALETYAGVCNNLFLMGLIYTRRRNLLNDIILN
jgi:hypothetical protein